MELFYSVDDLERVLGTHTKWQRTAIAIRHAPCLARGVAHSAGDSLTYWREPAPVLEEETFTAHRRYHEVVHAARGSIILEYAPFADLIAADNYSDLTDRQLFIGSGTRVELPEGAVAVLASDEAVRRLSDDGQSTSTDAEVVTLHVTIEGSTFHNK